MIETFFCKFWQKKTKNVVTEELKKKDAEK
jgi:hypothetical protein